MKHIMCMLLVIIIVNGHVLHGHKSTNNKSVIIFLNGCSSAGKTTLARNLQDIFEEPYLHVGFDIFASMIPRRFAGTGTHSREGFALMTSYTENGMPILKPMLGPVALRLLCGMRHAIAALACNNNLIIDEVLFSHEFLLSYRELLKDFRVYFIGVNAPLEVIEEREKERNDRPLGLARGMYDVIHNDKQYDLVVDSSVYTALENAYLIKEFVQNNQSPRCFWQ